MLVGCYYRCPIAVEEGDKDHPHFFVLAQLVEYNEIADAIKVEMHDLLGSGQYYGDLFRKNVFFAQEVTRCEACPGGVVEGRWRHDCVSYLRTSLCGQALLVLDQAFKWQVCERV